VSSVGGQTIYARVVQTREDHPDEDFPWSEAKGSRITFDVSASFPTGAATLQLIIINSPVNQSIIQAGITIIK
jgi:hypothetical protein